MNKKLIIICIAAIVIIGGGAAYLLSNGSKNNEALNSSSQDQSSNTNATDETSLAESTVSKLLGAGLAKKCTYSDASTSGTIYIATNNRMRADYTSADSEGSSGSMILTDNKHYIWDSATKEGVMMSYDPSSTSGSSEESNDAQSVDMNQEYSFNCNIWMVDESLLTPPADVNFVDMAAMMQEHMQ